MSDAYATTAASPVDSSPVDSTPADDTGKISQQEAHYRDGNLIYHCGLCKNFEGAANGTCTKVEGNIIPYGLSDEYDGFPNPIMHKTPPQFQPRPRGTNARPAPSDQADQQTDQYDEPTPPGLRIGRKVY
jgi:hypothetical protein